MEIPVGALKELKEIQVETASNIIKMNGRTNGTVKGNHKVDICLFVYKACNHVHCIMYIENVWGLSHR